MSDANADHGSGERLLTRLVRRVRLRGRRPGAVLVMVALSLVGLVGVVALAIDLGMLFSARAEAQRIADAAALAGASAFIDHDPETEAAEAYAAAEARTYEYAQRQSLLGEWVVESEVTPMIVMDSQKVRVRIRRETVPLFFARVFGITLGTAHAVAAAEAVNAGRTTCVKPFAIPDLWSPLSNVEKDIYRRGNDPPIWDFDAHLFPDLLPDGACPVGTNGKKNCAPEVWSIPTDADYDRDAYGYNSRVRDGVADYAGRAYERDSGRRIPLKMNSPHMTGPAGWFFPWRMPGSSGGNDYRDAITGCVNAASVGTETPIDTEPGNMIGPTDQGIRELLNRDPGAYWYENPDGSGGEIRGSSFGLNGNGEGSPRVITVALIDPTDVSNGMTSMRFVNFAQFFLEDPDVVYRDSEAKPNERPVTGRLMKFASGLAGPEEGNLIKRLRLVE